MHRHGVEKGSIGNEWDKLSDNILGISWTSPERSIYVPCPEGTESKYEEIQNKKESVLGSNWCSEIKTLSWD